MDCIRKSTSVLVVLCMVSMAFAGLGHDATDPHIVPEPTNDIPSTLPPGGANGHFTENLGQWGDGPLFLAQTAFGRVGLGDAGVLYDLAREGGGHAVRVRFAGADGCRPVGRGDMGFPSNYLLGNDPGSWVTGARSYEEVLYEDVWPGIDVVYRFSGGHLKYDILVGGSADPSRVAFSIAGHKGLEIGADRVGIRASKGLTLQDRDLAAWYDDGEPADVGFRPVGSGFGFDVEKEPGRALVIDPLVLPVSTFLGGTYADKGEDIEQDAEGDIYVAGTTVSTDFPVTEGAYSVDYVENDLVVTKLDRNCSRVVWSTYIGGPGDDGVTGIELDDEGNIYMLGETKSASFPTTKGALQTAHGGQYAEDLYILKLRFDGAALEYSTLVGGLYAETAADIKVLDGIAYVGANTASPDFPYGDISVPRFGGSAMVFTISEDGSRMDSLMHWDSSRGNIPNALYVDGDGNVTLAGMTASWDFPTTPGAYMEEGSYNPRSFVLQCDPDANKTVFATYFGYGYSYIQDVTLDDEGYIYLTGTSLNVSATGGMELTEGAFCITYKGRSDAFITKMDPLGTRLVYSTLVGGESDDYPGDIELTDEGYAVLGGWLRDGAGYEVTPGCLDPVSEGVYEGFVFVLNENGTDMVHSTYLGGMFGDYVTGVEISDTDTLLLSGATESKGFPSSEGAYQTEVGGDMDIYVSELCCLYPPSAPRNLTATGGEGNVTLSWEPPIDDNGYAITHYRVHRGTSTGEMDVYQVLDAGTTFMDEDVEYGVRYFYAISAFNGRGMSPTSNVASARSVTRPDPPASLSGTVHHDHVRLTWAPPDFCGGLPLEDYRLYRGPTVDDMRFLTTVPSILRAFVDLDVVDRTTYVYMLAATNGYGESEGNPTVTLRATGVPTPPRDLDHTYGDQYIGLTWVEPEDDYDLAVARYHVYRGTVTDPVGLVGVVSAPGLAFEDGTVEVGVLYRYHVVAENAKGRSGPSATIEAMTMVIPDRPKGVEATASQVFVRITWGPPDFDGASPITGYRVYTGRTLDGATLLGEVNAVGVEEPRLVFLHEVAYDGLVREYFVTAVNVEGESEPSDVARTLMFDPPSRPRSLQADWGDSEISLGWTAPESDGGTPVVSYRLIRRVVGEDVFVELGTVPASTLRYVDGTVANGVEYAYWLTAINLAGESEASPEVTAMAAGPPEAPGQLVAEGMNGSVRLTWDASGWDGGLPITGYRVFVISHGMQAELLSETGPDDREHVHEELVNGVVYLYAVRALSEAGESELGDIVEGRPAGAPSSPRALTAVWMDGMVYVTWSSPQDDGGASVTGYRLHREDWEAGNWTDVPALSLMFSDRDVEHEATYNYSVYALNDAGRGPIVRISYTVPPEPEETEDEPLDLWPWVIVGALLAVIVAAIIAWRRPRPAVEGPDDDEEPIDEPDDVEASLDGLDDIDELLNGFEDPGE